METKDNRKDLEQDCLILALRLMAEDPLTFAPETEEVMSRWRPRCLAALMEAAVCRN